MTRVTKTVVAKYQSALVRQGHVTIDLPFSVNSVDISSHSSLRHIGNPRKILALMRATKRRITWYGLIKTQSSVKSQLSTLS
jgi:hypothetical protein